FPIMMLLGMTLDRLALSKLYDRDHLDQVLATFGLILFFNELARMIWGPSPVYMDVPDALSGAVQLFGIRTPRTACSSSLPGWPLPSAVICWCTTLGWACCCAPVRLFARWSEHLASISACSMPSSSAWGQYWRESPDFWQGPSCRCKWAWVNPSSFLPWSSSS